MADAPEGSEWHVGVRMSRWGLERGSSRGLRYLPTLGSPGESAACAGGWLVPWAAAECLLNLESPNMNGNSNVGVTLDPSPHQAFPYTAMFLG